MKKVQEADAFASLTTHDGIMAGSTSESLDRDGDEGPAAENNQQGNFNLSETGQGDGAPVDFDRILETSPKATATESPMHTQVEAPRESPQALF